MRQGHPKSFGYQLMGKLQNGTEIWERPDGVRETFGPGVAKFVQHPDRGWSTGVIFRKQDEDI